MANLVELMRPDMEEAYQRADIIVIEELQFFPDAYEVITKIISRDDKTIITAGLTSDYKRQPFGDVLRLVPYADQVTHLRGLCCYCRDGTPGAFTLRTADDTATTLVAANDAYKVVCREHYECYQCKDG